MKCFLLSLICFISISVNAQSWVENNAIWHYDYTDTNGLFGYYIFTHVDDTVLYGQTGKIIEITKHVYHHYGPGPYDIGFLGFSTIGGLITYSDADRVYRPSESLGGWRTFLDFSAQVNDTWWFTVDPFTFPGSCNDSSGVIVTGVGINNILGVDYRYIDLESLPGSQNLLEGRFYERFGGDSFFAKITEFCDGIPALSDSLSLRCFQDDSLMMNFVSEDCNYLESHLGLTAISNSIEVYPNPTNGLIHFSGTWINKVHIISIEGQIVNSLELSNDQSINLNNLPKGSYFIKCITEHDMVVTKRIILE